MLNRIKFIAIITNSFFCLVISVDRNIDLTWDFDNNTIYWTGIRPFEYTKKVASIGKQGYWYAMSEFCAGEHGGTHFDAPYHFYEHGWKVGDVPLDRLIAKGAVIDLRNETGISIGKNLTLDLKHLTIWQKKNGIFDNGTVLLVRFGHSQYWNNKTEYVGIDKTGNLNFPGISEKAAEWIVTSGKFYGVGIDTPSVDPGNSQDFMAHRIFSKNQLYGLENVKLIDELPAKGFMLLVMPMKLREGTGAPVRIVAIPQDTIN